MLAPEVETRPPGEQFDLDDAAYRAQLVYLFERSEFYRDKLAAAGCGSAEAAGGLTEIARLPLTDKRELRATCTTDNPIGTQLCAAESEIVRIYSTSGTTGSPSYIPLTAGDLDNWVTGSARSYAASGVGTGNTERLMAAVERLRPAAAVLTPSYAAYLVEWSAEREFDLRASSVERV